MTKTTDVAIIGGGVIGCAIAYYLSRLGIRSTVFERDRLGCGASGATAGLVTPLQHVNHANPALFALGMRSFELFPGLAAELREAGIDPLFRQCGVVKLALTAEEARVLKDNLSWQGELGLGVRWLNYQEVLDLEPQVNPQVLGGVLSPLEGHVTGQRLVDALAHAASQRGAMFLEGTEVVELEAEGNRVIGVRTASESFHAGHTVLAAGPWTGLARRWIPATIPVRPVKGQRLLLRKKGFLPRVVVHSFNGTITPQSDGSVLVGATRHEGTFDHDITVDAIAWIVANAALSVPALKDARLVEARAGVRPGSPDDVPIIGPIPAWDGLSIATGHDGCGIMLSAGTAELMASYISKGDPRPLEPFSPSRFRLEHK
jgi:glycine oxidase